MQTITNILPYTCITNDVIIGNTKQRKTVTAVLEINISEINSEEVVSTRHQRIIDLVGEFPDDSYVTFYYIKTFKKVTVPYVEGSSSDIVNYLQRIHINSFESKKTPEYKNFMAITINAHKKLEDTVSLINKVGKNKGLCDVKMFRKAMDRLSNIIKQFKSAADGGVFRLDSSQITQFLSLLINKEYMEYYSEMSSLFTSDFNYSSNKFFDKSKGAYIYYGGNYHSVLSQRTNDPDSKMPENSSALMNNIFHHKDLVDIEFIIQHTIKILSKRGGIDLAKKKMNMIARQGMLASKLACFAKTPEGLPPDQLKELIKESIEVIESSNQKFLIQSFQVHLWADTLEKLDETYENFSSVVYNQYPLKREKYNLRAAFFSLFPGFEFVNPINTCLASYNVADFLPIDLPRQNYPIKKDNNFIYFYTEEDQFFRYDMFSKSADNWNAMIIGGSGSGKSFLTNNILYQFAIYNPQIAIVDYGGEGAGSYRNFVINQRGTYLEISLESNNFSINPFDGKLFNDKGELNKQKFTSLLSTIERMITSKNSDVLDNSLRFNLQQSLRQYYKDTNNNAQGECCIDEFTKKYLNNDSLRILFQSLFAFIGIGEDAGPYAHFFRSSKEIKSKDIVAFDMAGLKGHEELKNVLVPALLDMIATNILGAKGEEERKKLLIMDEAWQDLKGGSMRDFMEEMFRTIRKLNGQISIITQRFSDILGSEIGEALLANTSFFYFVGNNHDPEPLMRAQASSSQGAISLSEFDIHKIVTCKSKSDFFLLTPFFSGLLKLYPTKEFCMLSTTDPDHKNILRKHMKKLGASCVTPEVIESARSEF